MVHYIDMIKKLGAAPNLDSNHLEHNHVKFIKHAFRLTNKKKG